MRWQRWKSDLAKPRLRARDTQDLYQSARKGKPPGKYDFGCRHYIAFCDCFPTSVNQTKQGQWLDPRMCQGEPIGILVDLPFVKSVLEIHYLDWKDIHRCYSWFKRADRITRIKIAWRCALGSIHFSHCWWSLLYFQSGLNSNWKESRQSNQLHRNDFELMAHNSVLNTLGKGIKSPITIKSYTPTSFAVKGLSGASYWFQPFWIVADSGNIFLWKGFKRK